MTYPNTSNANGIWTLRDTFLARKGNIWPSVLAPNLDPFFDYVSLLLSMDGIDASTTFTDSSNNNFSITAVGDAQISTSQSKFGGASLALDGTGDYLSIAHNSALAFGSDNFTIECWVYPTATPTNGATIYQKRASGSVFANVNVYIAANTLTPQLIVSFNGSNWGILQNSSVSLTANEWNHLAVVRDGSQWSLYVDGVSGISATNSGTVYDDGSAVLVGAANGGTVPLTGYIDDFRITKGFARYTADFTPPTLPFGTAAPVQLDPYFDNVSLLMHMDGMAGSQNFIDDGPLSLSVVEDTSVVIASSPAKFEQSADFPNGQYLQLEDNTSPFYFDGPFTVEFWAYWDGTTASASYMSVLGNHQAVNNQWAIYMESSIPSYWMFTNNGHSFAYTPPITANVWQHIAITRDSNNTMRAFLNGVSGTAASSVTPAFYLPNRMYIGWEQTVGRQTFQGYLDEIRITKGICRYSANFTPPTKAFPDTLLTNDLYFDNVSLLLPMDGTNGSTTFTDESNNGLTVTANGNAQISTTQSKFGGSSAKFDGTGDYLAVAGQTELALGTSDFTIEMWIYPEVISPGRILVDTRVTAGDTGYVLLVNGSSKLVLFSSGAARVTSVSSVSLNQWTHVAVSREAGTLRAFLDGQLDASATYASSMTSPRSSPVIGIQTFGDGGWQGYIDDFRITKGVARYTASFNPPTRALLNE